jgi:hypothetical protein
MPMARHRVAIYGRSFEQMRDLVLKHHIDVLDHGTRRRGERGFRAFAILDPDALERLRSAGYVVEVFEDVDATGKARQAEVGKGNRYARPTDR